MTTEKSTRLTEDMKRRDKIEGLYKYVSDHINSITSKDELEILDTRLSDLRLKIDEIFYHGGPWKSNV